MDMNEVETKNLKLPAGWYFSPMPYELITDFLLEKIKGLPFASDVLIVRDGVQLLDPEQHHFGMPSSFFLFYLLCFFYIKNGSLFYIFL